MNTRNKNNGLPEKYRIDFEAIDNLFNDDDPMPPLELLETNIDQFVRGEQIKLPKRRYTLNLNYLVVHTHLSSCREANGRLMVQFKPYFLTGLFRWILAVKSQAHIDLVLVRQKRRGLGLLGLRRNKALTYRLAPLGPQI